MFMYDCIEDEDELRFYGLTFELRPSKTNSYTNSVLNMILNLNKQFTYELPIELTKTLKSKMNSF